MGGTKIKRSPHLAPARDVLATAAAAGVAVTYGELMRKFKISRGRPLAKLIGQVDEAERRTGAPGFAAIIVRKDTHYPGGGYFCDPDLPANLRRSQRRGSDPRLSRPEKDHIRLEQRRIWAYYRNMVRTASTT